MCADGQFDGGADSLHPAVVMNDTAGAPSLSFDSTNGPRITVFGQKGSKENVRSARRFAKSFDAAKQGVVQYVDNCKPHVSN